MHIYIKKKNNLCIKTKKIWKATDKVAVTQVNIKTPKFIEIAINGCFSIIEAQFHLRNVTTNNTKFYMMIVSLPADMVAKIPPFILESKNYEEPKKTITTSQERMKPEFLNEIDIHCYYNRMTFSLPA